MTLGEAFVNIRANLKPLQKGLLRAKKLTKSAMTGLARSAIGGVTKIISRVVGSLLSTIKRLVKITATAFVAINIAAIKAFTSFEAELANVNTMLTKQTEYLIPKYGEAIHRMSVQFAASSKTLSRALYNILSASIAPEKALEALSVVAKAAQAGLTETSTAAYAITGVLNAYGMTADKAGKISDILFATVKKGQTTFDQLAGVIGRVTAISATAGVSFEEVGAAIATITRGGINTQEAVTGLRQALVALQGRSDDAVKTAKKHGIELSVQALKTKGLIGMIRDLQRLEPEVLKDIFKEIRARTALNVLMKDQAGLINDLELATNSAGLTQEAFSKQTGTLSFKFKQLWQTIKVIGVNIGDVYGEKVKTAVENITKWLTENQDTIYGWAAVVQEKVLAAVDYFQQLWDLVNSQGWSAALEKLGADIKKALTLTMEFIKPYAIDIGKAMARGFFEAINNFFTGGQVEKLNVSRRRTQELVELSRAKGLEVPAGPGETTFSKILGKEVLLMFKELPGRIAKKLGEHPVFDYPKDIENSLQKITPDFSNDLRETIKLSKEGAALLKDIALSMFTPSKRQERSLAVGEPMQPGGY